MYHSDKTKIIKETEDYIEYYWGIIFKGKGEEYEIEETRQE